MKLFIFLFALFSFNSCAKSTDSEKGCVSDSECRFSRVCETGRCVGSVNLGEPDPVIVVSSCLSDDECDGTKVCTQGECVVAQRGGSLDDKIVTPDKCQYNWTLENGKASYECEKIAQDIFQCSCSASFDDGSDGGAFFDVRDPGACEDELVITQEMSICADVKGLF